MGGGAWPFLVGGAICLVNSDNERDSSLLNRWRVYNSVVFRGCRVTHCVCWCRGGPGGAVWFVGFRASGGFRVSRRMGSAGQPCHCLAYYPCTRPSRFFLEGQAASSRVTLSNNRSVMPLDVLGRTRATLKESACFTLPARKRRVTAEPPSWLGLGTAMIPMNQESLVGAGH